MDKNKSVFTKKAAELLVSIRKKANLSQTEIAKQIGLSAKSGKKYISYLETGRIKNPSFNTIILYLEACNTSYNDFFSKLSRLRFTERHQKIMEQMPSDITPNLRKKIDRDTALYANKIKHQIKTLKLDFDKLEIKIERELAKYLSDHKIGKDLMPIYQDFASHILKRVLNSAPNPALIPRLGKNPASDRYF